MEGGHDNQGGGRAGKNISPRLNLPQARAYKKFKIGELFLVQSNPQLNKESFVFSDDATYPYFTRTVMNNGILGYVEYLDECHKIAGNSLAVGMLGMQFFYMGHDFYAGQFTKTVFPLFAGFNEKVALYFISILNRSKAHLLGGLVRDFETLFSSLEVVLPTKSLDSTSPDFAFMEEYIRALERERIRALEGYLKVVGFENTELTIDEEDALAAWSSARMREFKIGGIGGLFDITSPPKRFNANAVTFGGTRPYVVRTSQNNGQRGCIVADETYLSEGKTISFGQDTATIFYQEKPYFTGDKIKVMKFNVRELDDRTAMFLITVMRKAFSGFMWGTSSFDEKILKNVVVRLPVNSSDDIDFVLIENFIRAVMKKSITGVVAWKDKEIATMARVVKSGADAHPRRILCDVASSLKFREYLPVYSLRAACGLFGDGESVAQDGWIKVEGKGRLDDTQFVVKTEGVSMEGLIESGSYAIFRKLGGGGLEGKVLLIQRLEASDPDSGGAYTIKKFTRNGGKVVLKARNPEIGDIELASDAEYSTKYRAIAEFKGVIP